MGSEAAIVTDASAKRAVTFQCREASWEGLVELARDLECSVDYLVNEAVKQYLRQRGVRSATARPIALVNRSELAMVAPIAPARVAPPPRPPLPHVPPPASLRVATSAPFVPAPPAMIGPPHAFSPARIPAPPPRIPTPPATAPLRLPAPPLFVVYRGARHVVGRSGFVIGRGKQQVDLTIKDPNVSRQHAMIEIHDGRYFLVDLGSTNGTEVNGQRVQRREVAEGDVIRICDHEARFTYRA